MVLYVPNIKDVFGLGGATVATLLMIVMPSGLHYKVSRVNINHLMLGRTDKAKDISSKNSL